MSTVMYIRVDDDVSAAIDTLAQVIGLKKQAVVNAILADRLWLDEGNPNAPRRRLANVIVETGEAVLNGGRGRC